LSQTNDSSSIGVSQIESRGRSDREDQGRNGKRKAQAETNKPDGENRSGGSSCSADAEKSAGGGREC